MKVIGRMKRNDGGYNYLVSVPEYPRGKNPTYFGNGKDGVISSLANILRPFYGNEDAIEDTRDKDVAIPDEVKADIQRLTEKAEKA